MNFVLDASVTLGWLLPDAQESNRQYSANVLESLKGDAQALVPVVWSLEVANVLARGEAKGVIRESQIKAFVELLAGTRVATDLASASQSLRETLELSRRYQLSSYDASYLELALRLALPIATLDRSLRKAAGEAGVELLVAT